MLGCLISRNAKPIYLIPELCMFREGFAVKLGVFRHMENMATVMASLYKDSLSQFMAAKVFPRGEGNMLQSFDAPSSFARLLRREAWMPTTDPWTPPSEQGKRTRGQMLLVPPSLCYLQTKEVEAVLGSHTARFCSVSTLDRSFADAVGARSVVSSSLLLDQLKQWAGNLDGFTTSVHHMESVYRYFVDHTSDDVLKHFRRERFFWVPLQPLATGQRDAPVRGLFYHQYARDTSSLPCTSIAHCLLLS